MFESPQWGGWVYKVTGRDGTRKTSSKSGGAKMLCYIVDGKNHGWHCQFKLPGSAEEGRAADAVKQLKWVELHPWKTLGPSGWVVARPRTAPQLKKLAELLAESRTLLPTYPSAEASAEADRVDETAESEPTSSGAAKSSSPTARRFDSVMRTAREQGWSHNDPDAAAFDG